MFQAYLYICASHILSYFDPCMYVQALSISTLCPYICGCVPLYLLLLSICACLCSWPQCFIYITCLPLTAIYGFLCSWPLCFMYDLFCSYCPYMLVYARDLNAPCMTYSAPTVHIYLFMLMTLLLHLYDMLYSYCPYMTCSASTAHVHLLIPITSIMICSYCYYPWTSVYTPSVTSYIYTSGLALFIHIYLHASTQCDFI